VPLDGLDPDVRYRIDVVPEVTQDEHETAPGSGRAPGWRTAGPLVVSGAVLGRSGLTMPILDPGHALVVHLTAES
jgi:hypothetical protein